MSGIEGPGAIGGGGGGGGSSSPALIRKRYVIRNGIDGIVSGTVDDTQAAANLVAMQAIVGLAATNSAGIEMDQEEIQIHGGPLIIPPANNGMIWDSSEYARLTQRSNNVAILQIGDTSNVSQNLDFAGINLHYLTDQSANTGANACVIYNQWKSRIGKIQVANTLTTARPYRGIYLPQSQTVFSCNFYDWHSFQAAYSLLHIANFGTGNVYENVYLSGVGNSGNAQAVTAPFLWDMNGSQMHDSVFNQLNLEWCITNQLMRFANVRGPVINSLHIEGNQLSGAIASFICNSISNVQINGLVMLDNRIQDANVTDAFPAVFRCFNNGRTNVDTWFWIQNTDAHIDMPFYVQYQQDVDGYITSPGITTIRSAAFVGSSLYNNMIMNRDVGGGDWGTTYCEAATEMRLHGGMTRLIEPMRVVTATRTIYGADTASGRVRIPGTLAANTTLTLSNMMGPATSTQGDIPVSAGETVSFSRGASGVNAFIVNNHDATEVFQFAAAGAAARKVAMMNDSGNWVEVT